MLLAVASIAVTTAVLAARRSAEERIDQLHRVESTLADAGFPFTQNVLGKMRGLSGAEFVALDEQGQVVTSTFDRPLTRADLPERLPASGPPKRLEEFETASFAGFGVLRRRVARKPAHRRRFAFDPVSAAEPQSGPLGCGLAAAGGRFGHDVVDAGDLGMAGEAPFATDRERPRPLWEDCRRAVRPRRGPAARR